MLPEARDNQQCRAALGVHDFGDILGFDEDIAGTAGDTFVHLDPAEFCVLVSGIAKTGDEHPFQDRIDTGKLGIGFLESFCIHTKSRRGSRAAGRKPDVRGVRLFQEKDWI